MYFDTSGVQLTNSLALRLESGDNVNIVPGTTNNSITAGRNSTSVDPVIVWDVPFNAPNGIIYQDVTDSGIGGVIDVVDKIGPTGATGATGPAGSPSVSTYTPVFDAAVTAPASGLTSGTFTTAGRTIFFEARVNFSTAGASFGAGQYSITLPVLPNSLSGHSFTGVIDLTGDGSTNRQIVAYAEAPGSAILNLWFLGTNSLLTAVTASSPVTLTTNSRIYINGSFIANS
jgi:hypothetical protein